MGQNLRPESGISKDMHKKSYRNLNCLICSLAEVICLGIIGYAMEKFDF